MMTATDWCAAGAAMPDAGRRAVRGMLEAAGLALNTASYNSALREFRQGQAAARALRQKADAEREQRRVEPFLAEARKNVMSWGCAEDGGSTPEEIDEMIREEAASLAGEAEEAAAEEARAAEREAEELADYYARQAAIDAAVAATAEAATAAGWRLEKRRCSHDSSRYYWLLYGGDPAEADDYDELVSLRISDHYAKNGSGWNEARQEQYDAPDINIVIRLGADGEYTFDLTRLVETIG